MFSASSCSSSALTLISLAAALPLYGCGEEPPLVSIHNETMSDLFEVRFSDCYWPGPLSPGATTSPACIPVSKQGRVTFSLLDEFATTPPPVGPAPALNRYETIEEIVLEEDTYHKLSISFQDVQIAP